MLKTAVIFCGLCWGVLFGAPVAAQPPLTFMVNHPGSPPFLYKKDAQGEYLGVVADFLQGLSKSTKLKIRFIDTNRQRGEDALYEGDLDLALLSPAWVRHPTKLLASKPLVMHRSFLYGLEPFPGDFSLQSLPTGSAICTRRVFDYPVLGPYFTSGKLMRMDSSSQTTMLKMLSKKRCHWAIMSEFNAMALSNVPGLELALLYRSAQPVNQVPLSIMLRQGLTREQALIDRYIEQFKASGELAESLDDHTRFAFQ
ncbi:MAG: polar amino acid transport system substrate-binding protein [Paraglaciecola sp.]|jgi:polar amino acid transport system substrate-binding protein